MLGMAAVPAAFVPMKFPSTWLPVADEPEMLTPAWPLPEMRFPAPDAVPPTTLLVAEVLMNTPALVLGTAAVPAALVPILFPCTWLPVTPVPPVRAPRTTP